MWTPAFAYTASILLKRSEAVAKSANTESHDAMSVYTNMARLWSEWVCVVQIFEFQHLLLQIRDEGLTVRCVDICDNHICTGA